jgi:hypothetical protein
VNLLCGDQELLALEEKIDTHNKFIDQVGNLTGLEEQVGGLVN